MNLSIDQIIAYIVTIVSVVLFLQEKFKNNKVPVYMALQGLLKAAYAKHKIHQSNWGLFIQAKMNNEDRQISLDEYMLYVQMVALDYDAQIEQILGLMKSLEIKEDSIFNKNDFTGHEEFMREIRERKNVVPKNSSSNAT
ncbi:hypothetical protein [Bowmanella denitrificans]|uniref:hypothetical protein n=1 Tax=Bowmanella denitrificans TaxID=366582 RepID=UPI000C99A16C|nr:hypothetical protein [Bowmanella denitrificans]